MQIDLLRPRLIVALIALTTLVGTVGCGGRDDDDAARVVHVWSHHGQPAEHAAMQSIVDAFNQTHADEGIRIELTFFPDNQYPTKVKIAASTDALPDILDIDGPLVGPWAAEGILTPIDDLIPAEIRDDMLPSLIAQGTYQDKLYALGAFDSALVVYYNRDIIAKAGLEPPEHVADAWTWDEFVAALEAVKPHVERPLALHMDDASDEWYTYAFSPLIWSAGGELIAFDPLRTAGVLDSDTNIAAIRRWQDLFKQGLASPSPTNPNPFSDGLVAFDWTGHWMLPVFRQTAGLNFGAMPLPRMGARCVVGSGSWCWGVSRTCDDREAAAEVLKWLLHPEHGIKPIVEANGAVPGRRSAFELFPSYETMPQRLFREQLEQAAHPRPRTAVYLKLTGEFAQALKEIATGRPVDETLQRAAAAVQRHIERR